VILKKTVSLIIRKVFGQFSLTRLFPNNSPIFTEISDISLTSAKFHTISTFSRQVVTLTCKLM